MHGQSADSGQAIGNKAPANRQRRNVFAQKHCGLKSSDRPTAKSLSAATGAGLTLTLKPQRHWTPLG